MNNLAVVEAIVAGEYTSFRGWIKYRGLKFRIMKNMLNLCCEHTGNTSFLTVMLFYPGVYFHKMLLLGVGRCSTYIIPWPGVKKGGLRAKFTFEGTREGPSRNGVPPIKLFSVVLITQYSFYLNFPTLLMENSTCMP